MKRTIHLKVWFTMIILFNLLSQQLKASHSMGADLTYQCLGGNTYKLTLSFYRDCVGIAAPVNPVVNVTSASCGQNISVTCHARPGTGQEITPTCSSTVTKCQGGTFTGIQEYVYDGTVTLPMQCMDWTFGYNLCCRNAAITTITAPGTNTFYIYSTLNNTISPCNNSPTFANKPVPFLCVGQQFNFNHGAHEPDGDSLAYSLVTPKQTSTTTVNYIAPYTAANPLNSIPATTFNSQTGDIRLTPQALQVTVMAVVVSEYRNGVLIGSVERDMQLTVMNCNDNLPSLTGINGTNNFSMIACAGQPFCFNIFSNDPDTGQNLTVTWDNGIPTGTFTSTVAQHPVSTFCWTPAVSAVSGTPHVFTVRVADPACPYIGSQIYSYSITVVNLSVNAGPDKNIACNSVATLTATPSGGSGACTYLWSNGSTTQSITVGAGTYYVTASNGSCSATDTVVVSMPFSPVAAFTFSAANCVNSLIHFNDQSSTSGGVLNSWSWDFGDGVTSSIQNPVHQYGSPGTYNVTLVVGNTLGCPDTLIQSLTINPSPTVTFTASDGCAGKTIVFTDQTSGSGNLNFWNWNFGDNTTSTVQNPIHTYGSPGTYTVTLSAGDSSGCVNTANRVIHVFPLPVVNAGPDQTVCAGSSVTLTATGASNYHWTPTGDTLATIVVSPVSTTNYNVTAADANGCTAIDMVTVVVRPLPVANAGPDQVICLGSSATLTATGGITYTWNPGGSTNPGVTVTPASTTDYIVTVTDANGCQSSATTRVTVNSLPVINAGPDQIICNGSAITISATGGTSYVWNPGGNTTPSILVTPSSGSNYVVTGTDANGCQSRDTMHVFVNNIPVVNIPATILCAGSTATLNAGNPGSMYSWSTGESTQTISVSDSGTYTVSVTNRNGCSTFGSGYVTLAGNFNTNPTSISICNGQSATLNAGNPGCTYLWNTGETTQSIIVNTATTYTVTVTDPAGCSGTILSQVMLNPVPVADFSATAACRGAANTFTDQSSVSSGTIQNYNWNFGDGLSSTLNNPTHTYQSTGTYQVILTITSSSGCPATVSKPVAVYVLPVADFTGTTVCQNQATSFSNLSTIPGRSIVSWNWNFGDGSASSAQNPIHTYGNAGSFNTTLIVTSQNGCRDTINKNIQVKGLPVAAFSVSNVCAQTSAQFNNLSYSNNGTITGYNWNFGNGNSSNSMNPGSTYSSDGTYNVQLIVTSSIGCTDTVIQPVTVYPLPEADFATSPVCENSPAAFINTSTVNGGTVTSLYWNFGDGSSSNQMNPSHTFGNNGTYTITLVATSDHQCKDTTTQNLVIRPLPVAHFNVQDVCVNSPANFIDASSISSGTITTWLWDFGDNSASSVSGPAHTYANPGTYDVSLLVTSHNGCSGVYHSTITIFPEPVVAYTAANVCFSNATQFFNQSSIAGGSNFTSVWDFSDSTTSSVTNPAHTFANPGTYTVRLTVTSQNGCSNQVVHQIRVYVGPISAFSADNGCLGTQTIFIDNTNTMEGSIASWLWDFGDGTTSNLIAPSHMYNDTGHYHVTLTTTTSYGCFSIATGTVHIYPLPVPVIMSSNACVGTPITFSDISGNNNSQTLSYFWNFNDGHLSSDPVASHTFISPGTYDVSLFTSNSYGCFASDIASVTAYPKPVAQFTAPGTCFPEATHFNNASTISTGNIYDYAWNFGDGQSAAVLNPVHTYAAPGTYFATLVSTSDHGCVNSDSVSVKINPGPQANFGSSLQGCSPLLASFFDSSWISQGSIAGWLWEFGDGSVSTQQHPAHVFTQSGSFSVSLTIVSDEGCQGSLTQPGFVTVLPSPEAAFTVDPDVIDMLNPMVHFTNLSQGYSSFAWNLGDGTIINNIVSPTHVFADTGSYTAMLIIVNSYGCHDTAYRIIDILPHSTLFAPNCFTPNGDGKNDTFHPAYTQMNSIQVWIYNRWGELLSNWDGLDGYWDGYYQGKPCQEDVYVYRIKGLGDDGKNYEWTGHVSIVH